MDVYYNPEEFELSILGEAYCEPDYSFDKFVVWEGYDGRLFYGADSGCSCPSPFENYHSEDMLTEVRSVQQLHDALDDWAKDHDYSDLNRGSVADLHLKLSELTRSFPYES